MSHCEVPRPPVPKPGVISADPLVLKEPGSNERVRNNGYHSFAPTPGQPLVKIHAILSNSLRQILL